MPITLRDYQQDGVDALREALRDHASVLYTLPTGGGKTRVFSHIAESAAAKGNRTCITVHRQELVRQSSMSLAEIGVSHCIVAPKSVIQQCVQQQVWAFGRAYCAPYGVGRGAVTIASIQSLTKRLDTMTTFRLVIVDEAHHAVSKSWARVAKAATNAHILGVTATPCRLDGRGLGDIFEAMVVGPSIRELVDMGHLCRVRYFCPDVVVSESEKFHMRAGDYAREEVEEAMDKPTITGDAIQHYLKHAAGHPAIAFAASVRHAHHIAEQARFMGLRAVAVDGSTDGDVRYNAIQGLADGSVDIVSSCDIISEGTDVPRVVCGILLRPTASKALYLQQVGRILRPSPGKDAAIILDHAGNIHRHDHPFRDHEWTLEGVKRGAATKVKPLTTCRECYAVFDPAPVCPVCGAACKVVAAPPVPKQIKQKDGELVEWRPEWAANTDIRNVPLNEALRKARTLDQLQEVAKARGYKPGWASKVWMSRQSKLREKSNATYSLT